MWKPQRVETEYSQEYQEGTTENQDPRDWEGCESHQETTEKEPRATNDAWRRERIENHQGWPVAWDKLSQIWLSGKLKRSPLRSEKAESFENHQWRQNSKKTKGKDQRGLKTEIKKKKDIGFYVLWYHVIK